jgi:hypothetical protein
MPLLFWMPVIIMSGLFGLALEPTKAKRATQAPRPPDEH